MGSPRDFACLVEAVERGHWQPVVDSVRPLDEATTAHERMEAGEQFGKLCLRSADHEGGAEVESGKAMRLQHVSTPYPEGADEQVRAFYGRLLGLKEKPVPDSLQGQGLVWFAAGDDELELHFLPDPVPPDPRATN